MEYHKNYPDCNNENNVTFSPLLAKSRNKNIRIELTFATFHMKQFSQQKPTWYLLFQSQQCKHQKNV